MTIETLTDNPDAKREKLHEPLSRVELEIIGGACLEAAMRPDLGRVSAETVDVIDRDALAPEAPRHEKGLGDESSALEALPSKAAERDIWSSLEPGESREMLIGDSPLDIRNESDRELAPKDLARIQAAYEHVNRVVGEKAKNIPYKLRIIGETDQSKAMAHADRGTMSVDIKSTTFDQDMRTERARDEEEDEPNKVDFIVDTLIHEMGHIVDFAATKAQLDRQPDPRVMSNFFNGNSLGSSNMLAVPYRQKTDISEMTVRVREADGYHDRRAGDVYGEGVTVEAPTSYAKKTPGEYFAECFRRYALDGTLDLPLRDAVQAAIDCDIPNSI